jgi:pimeloyl-ACP methyl ester carboxylesterase
MDRGRGASYPLPNGWANRRCCFAAPRWSYDSASLSYEQSIGPISQYHRVFAPDWPGYGQSDKPKVKDSTEYYVDILGYLMDTLGLEKASLVGISMGGAISLGFSLRWPQRVEKLVLVGSHGLGKEKCLGG